MRFLRSNTLILPAVAVGGLVGIAVLRFFTPDDIHGVMLFALVPVVALAMMFGARAGFLAALFASAAHVAWAATTAGLHPLEYIDQPLALFALGLVSGFYAHGVIGDFHPERQALRRGLHRAIARDELVMHYQPIVDVATGEVLALEALVRWQHPGRGLVEPGAFVPAAERDLATIRELTLHTFELAATWAQEHAEGTAIRVAVNLSPAALRAPGLADDIRGVLERLGVAPDRLDIEITETAFGTTDETIGEAIETIRRLGVGMVVIDDFGVGYSSLARLSGLSFDALKIDRALVTNMDRPHSEAIFRAIVELAHGLGLPVIAEGVEDEHTRQELMGLGCDALQGFHLSPPLPASEIETWLGFSAAP